MPRFTTTRGGRPQGRRERPESSRRVLGTTLGPHAMRVAERAAHLCGTNASGAGAIVPPVRPA